MKVLLIVIMFFCLPAFGQTIKIGDIPFFHLTADNKPAETVYASSLVYEDNILRKGKKIPLYVEVIPAKNKTKKNAPMFILMGGPGQAATDLVTFFAGIFESINQNSDIVFIDQRGTGRSNPLKLSASYDSLQSFFNDEFTNDTLILRNYQSLSKVNNLKMYGTNNAVLDIETIRKKMGYKQINIYGTSYGTRVALAYMNKFPGKVRTATLKGLVPDNLIIPFDFAIDAQRSMDMLIMDCAENDSCKKAYPGFEKAFKHFMASTFPLKAETINPRTQKPEIVEISKGIIGITLRVLLMSPSAAIAIPYLITEANKGNYTPLASVIITVKKSYITGLYDAMSLCVTCFEDYPLLEKKTQTDLSKSFLSDYWIYRIKKACAIWNSSKSEITGVKAVKLNIPVLLVSGNRDAATPPKYGEEVLRNFPRGRHLIIDQASHSFNGMTDCIENIICEFVKKGNANNIEIDCIGKIKFPEYKLN